MECALAHATRRSVAGAIWRGRQSDRLGRQWDESGVGAGLIGLDDSETPWPQRVWSLERVPWHLGGLVQRVEPLCYVLLCCWERPSRWKRGVEHLLASKTQRHR